MSKREKHSQFDKIQILNKQKGLCNHCGKKINIDYKNYHVDHIKSLSKGGDDMFGNLQILCLNCHEIKSRKEGYNLKFKEEKFNVKCKNCKRIFFGASIDGAKYRLKQHLIGCNLKRNEIRERSKFNNAKAFNSADKKVLVCKVKGCTKEIEGYNLNHVNALMRQHMFKHENQERKEQEKKEKNETNKI